MTPEARPDPVGPPRRVVPLAIFAALVVAGSWLWWSAARDPETAFLTGRGTAHWILDPQPPRSTIRPALELETRFRRSFTVEQDPTDASLRVRAFRRYRIELNGAPIEIPDRNGASWKRVAALSLEDRLVEGTNEIVVRVVNDRGPPALWLELSIGADTIVTDGSWESSVIGSEWRRARLAVAPGVGARLDPDAPSLRPFQALRQRWPAVALFALLSGLLSLLGPVVARRLGDRAHGGDASPSERWHWVGAGLVLALWALLFWNNAPSLAAGDGYDAEHHLRYVQSILDHRELPRADQGWAMFQPPLYYMTSAGLLTFAGLSTTDPGAAQMLRVQSLLFGVAQLSLLFACLGLVFPGSRRRRWIGFLIGAFLPVHLYLFQFPTNETLAATLSTAGLYLALRLLREERASTAAYAGLGVCLGAAMLAKLSALLVVVAVMAVLAGRLAIRGAARGEWLRTVGVTGLAWGLTCGWHFGRVWRVFGSPFVGNWDPRVLPAWWQDPGYHTASFYLRFGRTFSAPVFSGYDSFLDGIYSTLWGDALIGGRAEFWLRPPWNADMMAIGYLLAVPLSLGILIGVLAAVVRLCREPTAVRFLLVGLASAAGLALVSWPLRIPIYSVVKAFFALPAVLALCVFGAIGIDRALGRWRWSRVLAVVLLGTWACNVYATFWIPRDAAEPKARLGWLLASSSRSAGRARAHLDSALAADPSNATARLGIAELLVRSGRDDAAIVELRRALAARPGDHRAHLRLASLLASRNEPEAAIGHLTRALETHPDLAQAHSGVGELQVRIGDLDAAIAAFRRAAGLAPDSSVVHHNLGSALARTGRGAEAIAHLREAVRLAPEDVLARRDLARILAANSDPGLRRPGEAVELAQHAARQTARIDAAVLDVLAIAYASAGRLDSAVLAAEEALALEPAGNVELRKEIRRRLALYRLGEPFIEGAGDDRSPGP